MVNKLDNSNFKEFLSDNSGTVLVDFYAEWCGPCKMIAPIVEELSEELTDVTFAKINVDQAGEIAAAFNVMSIPTLIVFKDGKEYKRLIGYNTKENLISELT